MARCQTCGHSSAAHRAYIRDMGVAWMPCFIVDCDCPKWVAPENAKENPPARDTIRDDIRRLERQHRALGQQIQELKIRSAS